MKLRLDLITSGGTVIPLTGSSYFTITDIDGMTQGEVSIESSDMSGTDGDYINAMSVNPRDVTITLRFRDNVQIEEAKRYLLQNIKLKRNITIELDYRNRVTRLTGVVQSIEIPRFELGVSAQISIHCSNPFWEDLQTIQDAIEYVLNMHRFPIYPTLEDPIVMGEIMDTRQVNLINNGDVAIGMEITIVANSEMSNPRIMRDKTSEFIEIAIDMHPGDELVISTGKGAKTVELNGNNVINKLVSGSTWLQLEVGSNSLVATNSINGQGMTVNIAAREMYL